MDEFKDGIEELEELKEYEEIEQTEKVQDIEETEQDEEVIEAELEEVLENEIEDETYFEEQYKRTKPIGKMITLVACTAIMLVSSTYAWFSAQKNVNIGGLKGTVKVAEGLEISLDAKYWSQMIDFEDSKYTNGQEDLKKLYASGKTFQDGNLTASDAEHNIIPTELVPVSTTGKGETVAGAGDADGIGLKDMNMYRGINQNTKELYEIIKVKQKTDDEDGTRVYTAYGPNSSTPIAAAHHDYPGYYAIDLFLRNSTSGVSTSAQLDGASVFDKLTALQLNGNSKLELQSSASTTTGLQNTVRVAFALYNIDEDVDILKTGVGQEHEGKSWNDVLPTLTASAHMTASQEQILAAYQGQTINDVAIWEPNASDHVQYVVSNNNKVTWLAGDKTTYGIPTADDLTATPPQYKDKFGLVTPIPTYALTYNSTQLTAGATEEAANTVRVGEGTSAVLAAGIKNIYDWATPAQGLAKQVTLQTEKTSETDYAVGTVKQLVSVNSTATNRYALGTEEGAKAFSIPQGKVCKVRMYVWLEGQDVDTINHASHGGGIELDVGLIKGAEVGEGVAEEPTEGGPYLPTGYSWVNADHTEIKDPSNNQYVWISVPRDDTVYSATTLALDPNNLTTANLETIETELKEYTETYRAEGYEDEFYSTGQHGFADANAYNAHKNTMLASVFKNEGFYVGKYETGIADTEPDVVDNNHEARTAEGTATQTPVIQADAYPYNFVTNRQAQELASTKFNGGGYTTSLMFGLQWDLVLKHLEVTNAATVYELETDSTEWGNYYNNTTYSTNSNGKYSTNNSSSWTDGGYNKTASGRVLLSTGASTEFERGGIYDLAGNVYEWTLEYTSSTSIPCAGRGGYCSSNGSVSPASRRNSSITTGADGGYGFRVSLF